MTVALAPSRDLKTKTKTKTKTRRKQWVRKTRIVTRLCTKSAPSGEPAESFAVDPEETKAHAQLDGYLLAAHRTSSSILCMTRTETLEQLYKQMNPDARTVYDASVHSPHCSTCDKLLECQGWAECRTCLWSCGTFCAECIPSDKDCLEDLDPHADELFGTTIRVPDDASDRVKYLAAEGVLVRKYHSIRDEWIQNLRDIMDLPGCRITTALDPACLISHLISNSCHACARYPPVDDPCPLLDVPRHRVWKWTTDRSQGNNMSIGIQGRVEWLAMIGVDILKMLEEARENAEYAMMDA